MGGQNPLYIAYMLAVFQSESKSRGNWRGQRAGDHLTHSRVTLDQQRNGPLNANANREQISGPAARVLCLVTPNRAAQVQGEINFPCPYYVSCKWFAVHWKKYFIHL